MSGIGTRSRSIGKAPLIQPQMAAPVARVARTVRNGHPNIGPENMAFLAIPVRNNDPEGPGAGEFPALIGLQMGNNLAEPAAAVEEILENILPRGDIEENIDETISNFTEQATEPRPSPSAVAIGCILTKTSKQSSEQQ